MTTPAAVLAQIKTDFAAFTHNAAPMFPGGVHAGIANVPPKSWSNPPIVIIHSGDLDPDIDGDEPELGEFTVVADIYTKDTRDDFGEASALGTDDARAKAALETIRAYIRANYNYKAGGVYGAALYLENLSEPEPVADLDQQVDPDQNEPDVYLSSATFRVINK